MLTAPLNMDDPLDMELLRELNPMPWMLRALDYNVPNPNVWDPPEHAVTGWQRFKDVFFSHGRVVDFGFAIDRDSETCKECRGLGLNRPTRALHDAWCAGADGPGWSRQLDADEVQALYDEGRFDESVGGVLKRPAACPSVEAVNKRWQHDAGNRLICLRVRATKIGIYGDCDACKGVGYLFLEPAGHLDLHLTLLRTYTTTRVLVRRLQESDLDAVLAQLRTDGAAGAARFARLPRP